MRIAPVLALVLVSAMAGCGGGGEGEGSAGEQKGSAGEQKSSAGEQQSSAGEGTPEAAAKLTIDIADFEYDPQTAVVAKGARVVFTNADAAPHTATADDASFDTGTLRKDETGAITVNQPGTHTYYCRFHAFMKASIEVN